MPSNLDEQFQTLHEIARAARRNLADGSWDYMIGATETETTLRRNRAAIDAIAFRPRVLRDTSKVDSSSTFLGRPVRLPVMLAPVGSVESFTPGGGATSAKASGAFGVPHMLSSACNPGLEATAAAADNYRVFQLYVRGDDAFVDDHVKRARDNGYTIFCMTVDSAHYSRRERDLDHGLGSLEVLPEVVRAVSGRAVVMVDGGFLRGTDVVKAIALGAQCVGLGRLQCMGLAAAGQAGLERALEILEEEIKICLGLLGVTSYSQLDASYLREARLVTEASALSAFPLL